MIIEPGRLLVVLEAAETLSDAAAYRLAYAADDPTPCPFPGCRLTAAEHHRLAYGFLAENRDLRRRIAALENGSSAD